MESRTSRVINQLRNSSTRFKRFVGLAALSGALIAVGGPQVAHSETPAGLTLKITCAAADHGPGNAKLTNTTPNDIVGTYKFEVNGKLVDTQPSKAFRAYAQDETTDILDASYEDKNLVAVDNNGNATAPAKVNCEKDDVPSSTTSTTQQVTTTSSTSKASTTTTSTSIAATTTTTVAPTTTSTSLMGGMTSTTIAGVINNQPPATIDLYALATQLQGGGDQPQVGSAAQNAVVSADFANRRTG